jgi:hypothetical protein
MSVNEKKSRNERNISQNQFRSNRGYFSSNFGKNIFIIYPKVNREMKNILWCHKTGIRPYFERIESEIRFSDRFPGEAFWILHSFSPQAV